MSWTSLHDFRRVGNGRFLPYLFLGALLLCGATSVDAAAETSLYMESAYREFIGQGQEYFYNQSNITFSIQESAGQVLIQVGVVYDGWYFRFPGVAVPHQWCL